MKKIITWVLLVATAALFVSTHLVWLNEMPDRVASHFNFAGKADGWMRREAHGALMLWLGLGIAGFMVLVCGALKYFSPQMLNVPNSNYWRCPENFPEACEIMGFWGRVQASVLLVWLTLLNYQLVLANQQSPPKLASESTFALALALLVAMALSVLGLYWRFRLPRKVNLTTH